MQMIGQQYDCVQREGSTTTYFLEGFSKAIPGERLGEEGTPVMCDKGKEVRAAAYEPSPVVRHYVCVVVWVDRYVEGVWLDRRVRAPGLRLAA
jgi:hypothetical protein